MLLLVEERLSHRKLRLTVCAFCRRLWNLLDERSRWVVEVAERYADGDATSSDLTKAQKVALARVEAAEFEELKSGIDAERNPEYRTTLARHAATRAARYAVAGKSTDIFEGARIEALIGAGHAYAADFPEKPGDMVHEGQEREAAAQASLIRDLAGNPFGLGTASFGSSNSAYCLASSIYADRAFDRLPILADALEEAGCTEPEILNHCRQSGEHWRGCWVIDLILAKS
jgi:hypothetical protein